MCIAILGVRSVYGNSLETGIKDKHGFLYGFGACENGKRSMYFYLDHLARCDASTSKNTILSKRMYLYVI